MSEILSKSKFKARALELLRRVERTGEEIILTDRGKPVVKIVPYSLDSSQLLSELRETVVRYDDPEEPVGVDEWEALDR